MSNVTVNSKYELRFILIGNCVELDFGTHWYYLILEVINEIR